MKAPSIVSTSVAVLLLAATLVGASGAQAKPHHRLDAVNLPKDGEVLFLAGQDSGTLSDFKEQVLDVDAGFPAPAGVSLYTNLVGSPLAGVYQTVDVGVGPTNFGQTLGEYDGALSVGLYLVDCSLTPLKAIAGDSDVAPEVVSRYQAWTDELVEWLRDSRRDVFLKIGYEFDGEWNCYQPAEYKAAFRHIANRIDDLGANNVATVWQTAAWPGTVADPYNPTAPGHWDRWYPGDHAVDWVGLSTFYHPSYRRHQWSCVADGGIAADPRVIQDDVLAFARSKQKPVMIAEAAPQGYDLGALTAACIFESGQPWDNLHPVSADEIWAQWFAPFFAYVHDNRDVIRAVSYINTHWDTQSNWECTVDRCPNGYWGDSRLQANVEILARVRAELRDPMWAAAEDSPPPVVDTSPRWGAVEAEYEELPIGWNGGAGYGGFALPEPAASNDRHVMLVNYQRWDRPSVRFARIGQSTGVTVRYAATDVSDDRGPLTYTLLINGSRVGSRELVDTGGSTSYVDDQWNVAVPHQATIELRLDGNIMWVDRVSVEKTTRKPNATSKSVPELVTRHPWRLLDV